MWKSDVFSDPRLPGGIVSQKTYNDCFAACISMLTGIDLGLLPHLPPKILFSGSGNEIHVNLSDNEWPHWRKLLRDNGYKMRVYFNREIKHTPHIKALFNTENDTAHAVVTLGPITVNPGNSFGSAEIIETKSLISSWLDVFDITISEI